MYLFKLSSIAAASGAGSGTTLWGPKADHHPLSGKDGAWLATCTYYPEAARLEQLGSWRKEKRRVNGTFSSAEADRLGEKNKD